MYIASINAQDNFKVIKINGNIILQRTGTALDVGLEFAQNENLVFKIPSSRAAVINPKRGRYLLTAESAAEFASSKSNFLPSANKISMRGSPVSVIEDLRLKFEGNYVIFDKMNLNIDPMEYPMNDTNYFYIRYDFKAQQINKKLSFVKDTLIINKTELISVDGRQIPNEEIKEMTLMYCTERGDKYISNYISKFSPVFPDQEALKKETGIILTEMKDKSYDEKIAEVTSFINDFYGKCDEECLKQWLKQNYNLKNQ